MLSINNGEILVLSANEGKSQIPIKQFESAKVIVRYKSYEDIEILKSRVSVDQIKLPKS